MSFKVYYSSPETTAAAGFGKVAHLPCIFDARPGYHRLGSRYLIDRGLGYWPPELHGNRKRAVLLSDQTMLDYAHWLANFLEWADKRAVDLSTCTYLGDIQGRYQSEMVAGTWSRDRTRLSPTTVNLRVQQACDFLTWMSVKSYRTPFEIPTETIRLRTGSALSAVGHRVKVVEVRIGKVRKNKRRLRMPTDQQVREWLDRVRTKYGQTKQLMCETILLTAVRREEVACWRIDTLPTEKREWHLNKPDAPRKERQVLVNIEYGAKGPCLGYDHGDKIGPAREIWIPLDLAERLHEYRNKHRNPALKAWVKGGKTVAEQKRRISESVHLFLDEETGQRVTDKRLYNCWTGVELPFDGWSPQLGRDWWACSILWREIKKHEVLASLGLEAVAELMVGMASNIIRMQIQPQLGHAHESTTLIYLQWVMDMLGMGIAIEHEAQLDSVEEAGAVSNS